jgi:hypothetical protein
MKFSSILFSLIFFTSLLNAQPKQEIKYDTTYYISFADKLVGRFLLKQRYSDFKLTDKEDGTTLKYHPDNILSMGIGAVYGWFSLNLAYGFNFLNPNKDKDSKYFSLQINSYSNKNLIDLVAQFYSVKPDFKSQLFGGSYQYVFNNKRFSYRAAFKQNEWQKKSSGSLLVGAGTYFGKMKGDSTFVPPSSSEGSSGIANNRLMHFYEFGPSLGYVYTLVIKKHFNLTGALTFGMAYGKISFENDNGKTSRDGFTPNLFSRFSAGYNSQKWVLNAIWFNDKLRLSGNEIRNLYIDNGSFRLVYAYRFTTGPKLTKRLRFFQ